MMIRKKKLRKLGLIPKKQKSKELEKFELMVSSIVQNVEKRNKDIKFKKEQSKLWQQRYAKSIHVSEIKTPNKEWMDGSTAKKDIFKPVNLNNLDIEEINAKRKANNIETPIEQAAIDALNQIKEKASRVAVICHKSGYQYIGSGQDVKSFGKKSNELEFNNGEQNNGTKI